MERLARLRQVLERDFHEAKTTGKDKTVDVVVDTFNRVNSGEPEGGAGGDEVGSTPIVVGSAHSTVAEGRCVTGLLDVGEFEPARPGVGDKRQPGRLAVLLGGRVGVTEPPAATDQREAAVRGGAGRPHR
jgi:hypothetical protein